MFNAAKLVNLVLLSWYIYIYVYIYLGTWFPCEHKSLYKCWRPSLPLRNIFFAKSLKALLCGRPFWNTCPGYKALGKANCWGDSFLIQSWKVKATHIQWILFLVFSSLFPSISSCDELTFNSLFQESLLPCLSLFPHLHKMSFSKRLYLISRMHTLVLILSNSHVGQGIGFSPVIPTFMEHAGYVTGYMAFGASQRVSSGGST